ncbi:MAG: NAD(P)H-hydrate dehydratase [Candidatus Cloacimonadaceae bacterium]|nr:NAD(P)H-hydrate dehydratase [Candidatus Cloacimonadaceae bacterium]
MNYILSAAQMRELDRKTIEEFGIPSLLLMETAGKGIAELIAREHLKSLRFPVAVLCGRGNNGGDGAVIARWLKLWGYDVCIVRVGSGNVSPDARINFELCEKLEIPVFHCENHKQLEELTVFLRNSAILVDAVFGTGFKGDLDDFHTKFFHLIIKIGLFHLAVDIPSWVNADTGDTMMEVPVNNTYAIGAYKFGHFVGFGKTWCGKLQLIDIGIPRSYFEQINAAQLITKETAKYPDRVDYAHKGIYGKVMIFGGTLGYTGAAVMAAGSALRSGAGLVYILSRFEAADIYAVKLMETITLGITESEKDRLPLKKELLDDLSDADCVVIGPGLGLDDYATKLVTIVLENCECPVVIDADAITLISQNPVLYRHLSKKNLLLTPHVGEFSRLAGIDVEALLDDTMGSLSRFVKKYHAQVLLKSTSTVYHDETVTHVNISGNDGLATGGSGDVLAGIIASFIAQQMSIPDAAINASYLMGETAQMLAVKRGTPSILPRDIIENLFVYEDETES